MLISFGQALELVKTGHHVARLGWNGKDMHLALGKGAYNPTPFEHIEPQPEIIHGLHVSLFEQDATLEATLLPTILMKTATGAVVPGWLASQADMLADDWVVTYCPEAAELGELAEADIGPDVGYDAGVEGLGVMEFNSIEDLMAFLGSQTIQ